jgi:hypothetical protein
LGNDYEVQYEFCVSHFLKKKLILNNKKYLILNKIFVENNNIIVLFGDDKNYFERFDNWFNNFL